jgi:sulfur carrier protein
VKAVVKVVVNGAPDELPDGCTVAQVVAMRARTDQGVAVAVNDQVVTKGAWSQVTLADGDRVEILTAVQGG